MIKKEHLTDPHYQHRTSLFKIAPTSIGAVIFLGDSITEMCEWQEFFPQKKILNRGVSGDSTFGVLDRLSDIIEMKPEKVFLSIGVNDLQRHYNTDIVIENIKKITNRLVACSGCKVYIQSILPVMENRLTTGIKNTTINYVNDELLKFAEENNIEFLDNSSQMRDNFGNLRDDLSSDGLHLNGTAYQLWIERIRLKVIE